jgi:ketosteroid isomerase-like protein
MDGYSFQAQLTRISPVGLVPEGLRIDAGFAGTVTDGPWAGRTIEGIDYLVIRPDGVGVIDAHELVSGEQGALASLHAEGYIVPPFPMPPLTALLDPAFTWPDVDLPLHGSVRVQTAAAGSAAANHTVFGFTGAVNMSRGWLAVTARAVAADPAAADADGPADAALLARGYQAFGSGDLPAVLAIFAPDIDWREPGTSALAGHYRGHDQVVGFFTQVMQRSEGTFRLEIHDILAGGGRAVALVTEHAQAGGATLAARAAHVWRVRDGLVTEFANYYHDQAAVDAFWGQPAAARA